MEKIFFQAADVVRVVLLAKYEGIYSDSDVILMQNLSHEGSFITRQLGGNMNSAFMRLSSHEPILASVIDAMKASLSTVGYYSLLGRFIDTVEEYCLKNCPDTYNITLKKNLQVDLLCCNITILGKKTYSLLILL